MVPRFFNPYRHFVGSFIPNWLQRRRGISPGAKLAYARLAQYADKKSGIAWPARKTLSAELGISARQVDRYITELEDSALIHVTRRGDRETNLYRFIQIEDLSDSPHVSTRSRHICPLRESPHMATKENQRRDSMKRPTPPAGRLKSDWKRKMDPAVKSVVDRLILSDPGRFLPRIVQWVKAKEDEGFDPPDIAGRLRELEEYEKKYGKTHSFWGWLETGAEGEKFIAKRRTNRLQNEASKFKNEGIGHAEPWVQAAGAKSI
jgi:hypothetical protein